jgi:hypothetical protein
MSTEGLTDEERKRREEIDELDREGLAHDSDVPAMSAILSLSAMWTFASEEEWDEFRAGLSGVRRKLLARVDADRALREIAALLANPPERSNQD